MKVGIIGIVGGEYKKDYWGTMEALANMGYAGVESPPPFPEGADAGESLARMGTLGLGVPSVGASREDLRDRPEAVAAKAKALSCALVSCYWGPCESREQLLSDAALYNRAGASLAKEGIKLCYHNHAHEFETVFNGVRSFDILVEHTDPANVHFHVDIAWVTYGGEDPGRLLRRLAGRVPIIHVKDIPAVTVPPTFTCVGTGIVDTAGAMKAAEETGVGWAVVEQDSLRNLGPMETAALSRYYLKELGY